MRAIWAAIRESGRPEFAAPEERARQDRGDRRSQPGPRDTTAPEAGAERRTNEKPNPDDRPDTAELDDARDAVTTELGDARAAAKSEFDGAIADLHETITGPADVRTAETPDTAADQLKAEVKAEVKAELKAEDKAELKAEVRAEVEAEVAKKIADLEAAHEQEKADIHARHAQEMGELKAKYEADKAKYEADKAESDAKFDDLFARIKRVEDARITPDVPHDGPAGTDSADTVTRPDSPGESAERPLETSQAEESDVDAFRKNADEPGRDDKLTTPRARAELRSGVVEFAFGAAGPIGAAAAFSPEYGTALGVLISTVPLIRTTVNSVKRWRAARNADRSEG